MSMNNNNKPDIHFVEITSFGCGPDAFVVDEVEEILKAKGKTMTLLKVDDVNNIGSLKLRVRSLLESLKLRTADAKQKPLLQTPIYKKSDKTKTIIVPHFSNFYSPFVETLFEMMGYKIETLPPSDDKSIQLGLQFSNNEICYPATLVIGDFIRALQTGNYDTKDIVLGMSQTGGQCRATNYIMLIKKAMLAAGYNDIPLISIAFNDGINNQQEFILDWKPLINIAIYSILFADAISKMYYSAVAHNIKTNEYVNNIRDKYIKESQNYVRNKDIKGLLTLLKMATEEFNSVLDLSKKPPKIGIVGEIYVKYNNVGHKGVVNWLVEQGAEVVMPPLLSFFVQYFVNRKVDVDLNLMGRNIFDEIVPKILQIRLKQATKKVTKIASNYKLWTDFGDIDEDAREASKIINLAAQFGEGWLIPAEIGNFNKHNVQNVVSLQPFGCIANHIISKGIEKKIKECYPKMNLLFLDFDSGVSDVNVHNRLHFMLKNARNII